MGAIFMALTDAEKIKKTRETAASLQQAKDSTPGRRQGDVAAKLTAYDATTGYYSWTEQAFDEDGIRYDKPEGLSGTPTYMPALPLASAGNYPITTFPAQVWLRPVIVAGTLGQVWEVLGSTIEVDLVEKVCVTQTSGVITGVLVQKGTYQLWGRRVADASGSSCTGDDDCCPVACAVCDGVLISRTLTITFSLSPLGSGCLSGIYGAHTLTYDGTRWVGATVFPNDYLIWLECDEVLNQFTLTLYCQTNTTHGYFFSANAGVNPSSTCDPLYLLGDASLANTGTGCFCGPGQYIRWEITE